MGKKNGKNAAAAAAADKSKPEKKSKQKKPDVTAPGPVPIRKIPSMNRKHEIGLYAAGSFQRAPSPKKLPPPPMRWLKQPAPPPPPMRRQSSEAAAEATTLLMPPPPMRRQSSVQLELQGNLLYLTLAPVYPELAGKLTGMLLELGNAEVAQILGDQKCREDKVAEALAVLRDAGDERALNLAAAVPAAPVFGAPLSVDIGAAMAAKEAAEGASSGLTPALHGLMRMSPRVSNNQFSSVALLKGAGM